MNQNPTRTKSRQWLALAALGLAGLMPVSSAMAQSEPAAAVAPGTPAAPVTPQQKMSYALGVQTVRNLLKSDVTFDVEQIIQGLRDAAGGQRTAIPEKEVRTAIASMQADVQRKLAADRVGLATRNRQRGEAFAAEYRKRPGVQVLPSQVMYRELQPGKSNLHPREDSVVRVAYRGTLLDGSQFDATEAGQSATLNAVELIPGWREALSQMTVGSRFEVLVPPHMAYGDKGIGGTVGPNESLLFTVELLDILR